ncbi:MAG: hypothetical protein JNL80_13020 [Phycisphaerae bacterium]|nr:hypothetical protein [Phycisphaerae bacterium]
MHHIHTTALAAVLGIATAASGQTSSLMRFDTTPHIEGSGVHSRPASSPTNDTPGETDLEARSYSIVRSPGAHFIRVHFGTFDLDTASEIHITSVADGATQRFTHAMLEAWDGWSAIFNGDAVVVQLMVASGESVSFSTDEIAVNIQDNDAGAGEGGVATLCGADNRTASNDSRVGRLSGANCGSGGGCGGCTAWLTSVGCALTAGHCGMASGGLIEFNVPASNSAGQPVASAPEDQYPVGNFYYAFQNGGVGFDWAMMDVGPNANTGLRAHWVQGYFHLDPELSGDGTTLRITGCGVDNSPSGSQPGACCAWDDNGNCTHAGCNSTSLTVQTSTGPQTDSGSNFVRYAVDTEPANSGSPVIRTSTDFAVGIHTNGGCTSGGGENSGTRIAQATLSEYLGVFLGADSVFVDYADISVFEFGTAVYPAQTFTAGYSLAGSGDSVWFAGGSYTSANGNTGTFTKAITLRAASGVVTIGN